MEEENHRFIPRNTKRRTQNVSFNTTHDNGIEARSSWTFIRVNLTLLVGGEPTRQVVAVRFLDGDVANAL